jgi:hypothetical protein
VSNPWFRLHADIIDDEKVGALAFSDRWFFVAVLCLKCDETLDKYKGHTLDKKVAWKLRISVSEVEELKSRLRAEGLIDAEWQPVAWDKRQFKSDSSAERVARHRAKQKQQHSKMKRPCNVTVTAPDTETDTDNNKSDLVSCFRGSVFIQFESPEWKAWQSHIKVMKLMPRQCKEGYGLHFKTQLPPSTSSEAA